MTRRSLRTRNLGVALALGALLSACATPTLDATPASPDLGRRIDTIQITDPALWRGWSDRTPAVAAEVQAFRPTETGTMELVAVLRNQTEDPLTLEVRTQFLDEARLPLEAPSAWSVVFLGSLEVEPYRERSTSLAGAAHYTVEIREVR